MMQLAKNGVCVLSWISFGKNADALFGQLSKRAMQISITKMSHFALVKRPMLKNCKTQKCRTGHGEKRALLCWSVGCKLPPATLEKCMLYLKTSKKQSYRAYSTSPHGRISWENQKNRQDTGTPKFRAALFRNASIWVQLTCPWKEKMDKEDVVLMYNGILLSN